MKKSIILILAGIMAAALSSCLSDEPYKTDKNIIVICPDAVGRDIIDSQNTFSCELFKHASATADEPNMIISPLSLYMSLSMTANGASGETLSELSNVLNSNASLGQINQLNQLLLNGFPIEDSKVTLSLANSIWIDNNFPILTKFVNVCQETYSAEINNADIPADKTRLSINDWAEKHTNGMIKNFFDRPIPPNVRLLLINALYFKGEWAQKFDKKDTYNEIFHNADGTQATVRMMDNSTLNVRVLEDDMFSAVTIPYGTGPFTMTLLLPNEGITLDDCVKELTAKNIGRILSNSQELEAHIKLPKFEIESDPDNLIEILKGMGINRAFSDLAEFDGISDTKLLINFIKQKARIIVDEEGTEAAAVTGVGMLETALPSAPKPTFIFNRPFAFYISERNTYSILFMGKVTKAS